MKKYMIPMIFLTIFLTTIAFAGSGNHGHGYHHSCGYGMKNLDMEKLDEDENGAVSFEEFSKEQMEKMKSVFNSIDTNKDGKIDVSEWKELRRVHGMGKDKEL